MLGENDKNAIVDRLMQIVTAECTTVQTKNGPVEDEVSADKNSLTAGPGDTRGQIQLGCG